jgi:hypothetical protein
MTQSPVPDLCPNPTEKQNPSPRSRTSGSRGPPDRLLRSVLLGRRLQARKRSEDPWDAGGLRLPRSADPSDPSPALVRDRFCCLAWRKEAFYSPKAALSSHSSGRSALPTATSASGADPVSVADQEPQRSANMHAELDVAAEAAIGRVRTEEVLPVQPPGAPDASTFSRTERRIAIHANGAAAGVNANTVDPAHRLRERPAPGAGVRACRRREHQSCSYDANGSPQDQPSEQKSHRGTAGDFRGAYSPSS